jgi:triosephosphate isomerase (TIM)
MKAKAAKKTVKKATKNETLIVANWKMNPGTLAEAKKVMTGIKTGLHGKRGARVVVCPPAVYLQPLSSGRQPAALSFGAQNCFYENSGAHTGEVGPSMLQRIGAQFVILGHSERRGLGEESSEVNRKITAAIEAGLTAIVCVGERQRDEAGAYLSFVREQVLDAVAGLSKAQCRTHIVFAYEPVWAIGGEVGVDSRDAHQMSLFIRKALFEYFTDKAFLHARLLYGGSVTPDNAADLIENGTIDGFLIGHHSLVPSSMKAIIKAVAR